MIKLDRTKLIIGLFITLFFIIPSSLTFAKEPSEILTVAHRGASGYAPENTIASFEKAIEMNSDYIEIDVHMTKDNELVVIHDSTVNRTTNGRGFVRNFTLEEIKQLDAGSYFHESFAGEQIPTFEEVLDTFAHRIGIVIEVKSPSNYEDIENKIKDILVDRNLHATEDDHIVIQSFDKKYVKLSKQLLPNTAHGQLAGVDWSIGFNNRLKEVSQYADYFNPSLSIINENRLQKARDLNLKVFPWTVRSQKDADRMVALGVDGIITDYPDYVNKHTKVREGTVISKYINETGKEIADRDEVTGEVGTSYETVQKDIEGYKIKEIIGETTGKFTVEDITVTYVYTLDEEEQEQPEIEGKVITKYVDEDGKEIAERNETTGKIGTAYETEKKDIPNYEFIKVKGNPQGEYVEDEITVTYVYKLIDTLPIIEGQVITKYVDENEKEVAARHVTSGEVGTTYETEEKVIPGYEFVEVIGEPVGEYTEGTTTITYRYKLIEEPVVIEGQVITKYVDETGKEIAERNETTGEVGTAYKTVQKDIPGYEFIEVEGNWEGAYEEGAMTVIYIYEQLTEEQPLIEGQVVTIYVDETGKEIAERNEATGEVGTNYETVQKDIPGYVLVELEGDPEGKYVEGVVTVTYFYERIIEEVPTIEGQVITKYVDDAGKEIAERNETTGEIGSGYETIQKDIPGYELIQVEGSLEGEYIEGVIKVTYVYSQIKDPMIIEGTVITKYVDEEGKELAERNKASGEIGTSYNTIQKDILGYELMDVEGNPQGKYEEGTITVIYIYKQLKDKDTKYLGETPPKHNDNKYKKIGKNKSNNLTESKSKNHVGREKVGLEESKPVTQVESDETDLEERKLRTEGRSNETEEEERKSGGNESIKAKENVPIKQEDHVQKQVNHFDYERDNNVNGSKSLPQTNSNWYNVSLLGLIFVLVGGLCYGYSLRESKAE